MLTSIHADRFQRVLPDVRPPEPVRAHPHEDPTGRVRGGPGQRRRRRPQAQHQEEHHRHGQGLPGLLREVGGGASTSQETTCDFPKILSEEEERGKFNPVEVGPRSLGAAKILAPPQKKRDARWQVVHKSYL